MSAEALAKAEVVEVACMTPFPGGRPRHPLYGASALFNNHAVIPDAR